MTVIVMKKDLATRILEFVLALKAGMVSLTAYFVSLKLNVSISVAPFYGHLEQFSLYSSFCSLLQTPKLHAV